MLNETSDYWNKDNGKFRNANECRDAVYIIEHSSPSHLWKYNSKALDTYYYLFQWWMDTFS